MQFKFIILQFYRLEVYYRSQWAKIDGLIGLWLLLSVRLGSVSLLSGIVGKIHFQVVVELILCFPTSCPVRLCSSSRDHRHPLPLGSFLPSLKLSMSSLVPLKLCISDPLIKRTYVIKLGHTQIAQDNLSSFSHKHICKVPFAIKGTYSQFLSPSLPLLTLSLLTPS